MLTSKVAEIDMYHICYIGHYISKQSFFRMTSSSINNNFGLPFLMKTKCMKDELLAYVSRISKKVK